MGLDALVSRPGVWPWLPESMGVRGADIHDHAASCVVDWPYSEPSGFDWDKSTRWVRGRSTCVCLISVFSMPSVVGTW